MVLHTTLLKVSQSLNVLFGHKQICGQLAPWPCASSAQRHYLGRFLVTSGTESCGNFKVSIEADSSQASLLENASKGQQRLSFSAGSFKQVRP